MDSGDDIVRVRQSTLIGLNRDARMLKFDARSVKAQMAGGHLSGLRGRGMEFFESRPYQAGDDIRSIDWRVTARSGRTHTKNFHEERERPVLLWLDLSNSMFFGTRNCFKSVLAARLAALLAWSSVQQGDRLGFLVFSDRQNIESRPAMGKRSVLFFIRQLVAHSAWTERTGIVTDADAGLKALVRLRQVARPGSLVILLSDFRFLSPACRSQLIEIARHNDVIMLQVHDPFEQELPPSGRYRVTDGNRWVDVDSSAPPTRARYRQRFDAQVDALKRLCNELDLYWLKISTTDDLLAGLKSGLGLR